MSYDIDILRYVFCKPFSMKYKPISTSGILNMSCYHKKIRTVNITVRKFGEWTTINRCSSTYNYSYLSGSKGLTPSCAMASHAVAPT
jgi:hypothetical protein